jgi:hypothetical protein
MGYTRRKTFLIKFGAGHEYAGLEVRMRSVSVERLLETLPLINRFDDLASNFVQAESEDELKRAKQEAEDVLAKVHDLFDSWNIEDTDEQGNTVPVPCTLQELMAEDFRLVNAVIQAWAQHLAGVPAPLEPPSLNGVPFPEASIPMESLSPNPGS